MRSAGCVSGDQPSWLIDIARWSKHENQQSCCKDGFIKPLGSLLYPQLNDMQGVGSLGRLELFNAFVVRL